MADQELDLRGLRCPIPVMRTKKKLQTMSSGQTLRPGVGPRIHFGLQGLCKKLGRHPARVEQDPRGGFRIFAEAGLNKSGHVAVFRRNTDWAKRVLVECHDKQRQF